MNSSQATDIHRSIIAGDPQPPRSVSITSPNEYTDHMDPAERMVLRKRKSAMMAGFNLSRGLLDDLKGAGLLSQEAVQYIELERSMSSRVSKTIDTLISQNTPDAFSTFVFVLASHDEKLSRDLQSDLRIERGEVHPSEDTLMDASMAVHMRFGTSKRFSESEKRFISELIATKLTIVKEEWEQNLSTVRLQLSQERSKNRSLEDKSRLCAKSLREFIKRHEPQLTNHAHELQTTRSALDTSMDESEVGALSRFYEELKKMLVRIAVVLEQRETLLKEHAKMTDILKGSGEFGLMTASATVNNGLPIDHGDKDRTIKRLNKRVSDLEHECEIYQNLLEQLQQQSGQPRGRKSYITV
ncbi:hypothetical protein CAPTEDRAFT_213258 [Capitella teleta]|uniref:CARD domain-containing protein n=1 Tax=Capitella teleta TaxID=283909 RepID=R7UY43_CAPTE|nr:hypothetical protein CAPTEDRAFT_213258 [Capitella teleta]|eukprot:ELU08356.1 hypothetical protein CAPTEDRAFT_213258 [Capitella teleta]